MGLLICPDCLDKGERNILGSVTDTGDFIMRRFTQGVVAVTIRGEHYQITCHCGYGTTVENKTNGHITYIASPKPLS